MNVNSVLFIVVKKGCPTSSSTWHKLIGWKRNYAKSTGCLHSHIQSTSHSDLIEIAKVKYHEVVTGIFFSLTDLIVFRLPPSVISVPFSHRLSSHRG